MRLPRAPKRRFRTVALLSAAILAFGATSHLMGTPFRFPARRARHLLDDKGFALGVPLEVDERESRIFQARELLGAAYDSSAARRTAETGEARLREFVRDSVRRRLARRWKRSAGRISEAILDEGRRRGLDPVFLMAMIDNESEFNPGALGRQGEIGLMQIKPDVAEWVARLYHIPYRGRRTLKDPVQNIRIGAAYVSFLRAHFRGDARLYMAAYNMGIGNVEHHWFLWRRVNDYPEHVLKHYLAFYAKLNPHPDRA